MRFRTKTICIALGIALFAGHSARAEDHKPCMQIKAACEQAGFKQGAVSEGMGLQIDCLQPIISGSPQRPGAKNPLPTIDPAVVTACKTRNPEFGRPKVNDQSGAPTSGSDN
jgi:hypothetical protein